MAKAPKAAPATTDDVVNGKPETLEDAGNNATGNASGQSATTTITASEERTGGDGDSAVSTQASSEVATDSPNGNSNDDASTSVASAEVAGQTNAETTRSPGVIAQPLIAVKLEQEAFTLALPTVHGGKLKGIGETVWLTREKHTAFVVAGRVVAPWPDAAN